MGNNSNIRARRKPAPNPSNPKASTKKTIWMIVLLLVLIVAGGGCGFISATMSNLPDVSNVRPSASSQIYDVHGNLITTVHSTENRLPVPINEVPKELQDAFVATEDSRFYVLFGLMLYIVVYPKVVLQSHNNWLVMHFFPKTELLNVRFPKLY